MVDNTITMPVRWVRVGAWCMMTGEPEGIVVKRIQNADWAAGKHYKRTSQRVLWINLHEAQRWIDQQPHVEALCPRVSRSGKARAEAA